MLIPSSAARVPASTADRVNQQIHERTRASIEFYSRHPDRIEKRLAELDEEWDTERLLEVNAAALAFAGTLLGATVHRRWLILPAAVTFFLFQHGVQGWCPPLPVLRRLGVRTPREIEAERYALKAIRGDFANAENEGPRGVARATGRLS